jgi:KaiC/GvpD/RAD55 family RecA-like ATPase
MGPSGVGKTTTALCCMLAALERGEPAVFYLFEEGSATFFARAANLGMNLRPHVESGLLAVHQVDPAERSPGEFATTVRQSVEEKGARVVVIDSLNGYFQAIPDEKYLILQVHELLSFLNQKGVVTLIILAQHGILQVIRSEVYLSYLSDAIVPGRCAKQSPSSRRAPAITSGQSASSILAPTDCASARCSENFRVFLLALSPIKGTSDRCFRPSPHKRTEPVDGRVLVLAPHGRDAVVVEQVLVRAGMSCAICVGLDDLRKQLDAGAGAAIVTEEVFAAADTTSLFEWLDRQPSWSDFPFVVLVTARAGRRSVQASHTLERLGHIVFWNDL